MTRTFAPPPPSHADIETICRSALGLTPTSLTEIRGGAWSSAVSLETGRGPMILRFSRTPDDFRIDEIASRFAAPDLPIPAVHGIGQLQGSWWCLSQRMPGVHLDDLTADKMEAAIPSLAAVLQAMRTVSAAGTTGYGGWNADGNGTFNTFAGYLLDVAVDKPGSRQSGWSVRLATQPHAQHVFDRALQSLHEVIPYVPDARNLVHRDTLNFNVTVSGKRISGIFDWGCAIWGDALYDLAWIRFCEWWYPQWASLHLSDRLQDAVGTKGDHVRERMLAYLLHIGMGSISYNAMIENWPVMNDAVQATEAVLRTWT